MSGARFATVADLFASCPTAEQDVGAEGSGEPSEAFVRRCLAERRADDAISFCAYLLPRREAVWWACACVSKVDALTQPERACLSRAREWAAKPDEARRRKALETGLATSRRLSGAWLALAAGWSGGSVAPSDAPPAPASPAATAQAVRVALLSCGPRLAPDQRDVMMTQWVEQALRQVSEPVEYA